MQKDALDAGGFKFPFHPRQDAGHKFHIVSVGSVDHNVSLESQVCDLIVFLVGAVYRCSTCLLDRFEKSCLADKGLDIEFRMPFLEVDEEGP